MRPDIAIFDSVSLSNEERDISWAHAPLELRRC
jgi:hypothetical protein